MITKDILISGSICGIICVAFMWIYMSFTGMQMSVRDMKMYNKMQMSSGMHKMSDGSMMMNGGSSMDMGSMTMDEMVGMMKGKTGKELEKEFLAGMIPHHVGAVEMAKLLLQDKTVSPEIAKFAQDIINAQEKEVLLMNDWLKKY